MKSIGRYCEEALLFLEKMISIPSLSFEEAERAEFIVQYLRDRSLKPELIGNNIIVRLPNSTNGRPVLMLNSHIDISNPLNSTLLIHSTLLKMRSEYLESEAMMQAASPL